MKLILEAFARRYSGATAADRARPFWVLLEDPSGELSEYGAPDGLSDNERTARIASMLVEQGRERRPGEPPPGIIVRFVEPAGS